jgi:hypothetical protein
MRPLVALIAVAVSLAVPSAALAHEGPLFGTDYRTTVETVPDGVAVRVVGGDDRIAVTRTGAAPILIFGYGDEPYLRLDDEGVWENRNSPAVALNAERAPSGSLTGDALPPDWQRVDGGRTALFHDHRTHWMGSAPPLAVREDPGPKRELFDWAVPIEVAGKPAEITGTLTWMGTARTGAWWVGLAGMALLALALGWLAGRRHAIAAAAIGAGGATAASLAIGLNAALDVRSAGRDAVVAVGILAALALVALVGTVLTRRTPAYATTVLLLFALFAGGLHLIGPAGPIFGFAFVPGPLGTLPARIAVVVGFAGCALIAGSTARAWREHLPHLTPSGERRPSAPGW